MKSLFLKMKLSLFVLLGVFILSCSKDDPGVESPNPEKGELVEQNGTTTVDDFEVDSGEIGLYIDTRELARQGYFAKTVEISTSATEGSYDQELEVNTLTNIAQLKVTVDGLDTEAFEELTSTSNGGITVTMVAKDDQGTELETRTYDDVRFASNGTSIEIPTEKTDNRNVSFNDNLDFYLQYQTEDPRELLGAFGLGDEETQGAVLTESLSSRAAVSNTVMFDAYENGDNKQQFFFESVAGKVNVYHIRNRDSGDYFFVNSVNRLVHVSSSFFDSNPLFQELAEFTLVRNGDNTFSIYHKGTKMVFFPKTLTFPVAIFPTFLFVDANESVEAARFRMLTDDVQYSVQLLEAEFMEPTLPQASTNFSYNSDITNCTDNILTATVGSDFTHTESYSVSTSETIGLSSSETTTMTSNINAGFTGKFFGGELSLGGSFTHEYSATTSFFTETSTSESTGELNSRRFFSERETPVTPGKTNSVADVYQLYEDIVVPYVEVLQIRATTLGGQTISGEELVGLVSYGQFGGVINEVNSDNVIVTLRGTTIFQGMAKEKNEIKTMDANCN